MKSIDSTDQRPNKLTELRRSILLITEQEYPSDHSFLEEVYSKLLPDKGYKIVWLMRARAGEHFKGVRRESWNNSTVYVLPPLYRHTLADQLKRKLWFLQLLYWMFIIIKRESIGVLQSRDLCEYALAGSMAKLFRSVKFIHQESFDQEGYALFWLEKGLSSIRGNYLQSLLRKIKLIAKIKLKPMLLRKADLVFPASVNLYEKFVREGIQEQKMMVVPLGFNFKSLVTLSEQEKLMIRKGLGLAETIVLGFWGVIVRERKLGILIDVIAELRKQNKNVRLLIIGEDTDHSLRQYAVQCNVDDRIVFLGKMSREEVYHYGQILDIGLSPYTPTLADNSRSPVKIIEMMSLGVPVIATDIDEQRILIHESGGGICVQYDATAIAGAVSRLIDNPHEREKMGANGRRYAEDNRSYLEIGRRVYDKTSSLF